MIQLGSLMQTTLSVASRVAVCFSIVAYRGGAVSCIIRRSIKYGPISTKPKELPYTRLGNINKVAGNKQCRIEIYCRLDRKG